jgi:exodeoxyribonuclease VII large subunit
VISAVGHEIDITIADLVADVRALTPSEAGELVVPNRADVLAALDSVRDRLVGGLKQRAIKARLRLDALASRPVLKNPSQRIRQLAEHLDDLDDRLKRSMNQRLEHSKQQLAALTQSLDALSPLGVLSRGYSVTFRTTDSSVDGDRENAVATRTLVRRATELQPGDQLLTYLDHGRVVSRVEQIDDSDLRATQ